MIENGAFTNKKGQVIGFGYIPNLIAKVADFISAVKK